MIDPGGLRFCFPCKGMAGDLPADGPYRVNPLIVKAAAQLRPVGLLTSPPPRSLSLADATKAHDWFGERLSDNSERLYESDNGVLGRPHRSAAGGRSGASETEMTQRRIDSLSLMYKKSSDPGNFPTASRHCARPPA